SAASRPARRPHPSCRWLPVVSATSSLPPYSSPAIMDVS
ncbi:hypothetical protein PF005_g23207, partial [Phytophthora fragariae]